MTKNSIQFIFHVQFFSLLLNLVLNWLCPYITISSMTLSCRLTSLKDHLVAKFIPGVY